MRRISEPFAGPLRGGADTDREPSQLEYGAFSMVQNLRPKRPGFIKRPGQVKQHSDADGSNKVLSIYQFRKSRVDENHVFAQFSDGDILEAANTPPTITSGVFGSEVYSGSADQLPASWANVSDTMIMSNGVDPHQIYGGESSYVIKFVVFKGAADPKDVPELGEDYSQEVTDGQSGTVAVLDSLDTWANWDAVYICTPVPADALGITVAAPNGNAAALTLFYRKNDNSWADTSATDGTDSGGDTLAQTGDITWTQPADEIPTMLFGTVGFWYQIRVDAALDAEVEISGATFQSSWSDLVNRWDGVPFDGIEVMVETGSATDKFYTYGAASVDVSSLASGAKIVVASTDPVEGIYIDVGAVPHTGTAPTFTVKYWDGAAFTTVGTVNDSTGGLFHSGWLRFPQKAIEPSMFQGTQYYAYWYEITMNQALTTDMNIGIQLMPYFNVTDFGAAGVANSAWREHLCYTFDNYSEYVYITPSSQPMVLNGSEFGILETGDGRSNRVLSMKPYFNNLFVWQEEKGAEGGTTTIFQGYDPTTYGKLILSTRLGIVNSKSSVIVEGVKTAASRDEPVQTVAFWLSRYGVCMSNGTTIWIISDDIQNYFDPTETECIRRGYEQEHWLKYDSMYNIIRIAIVSGESATVPNIFLCFDLTDQVWYFDVLGQELSCMEEVESGSGDKPITQVGGGTDDGTIYVLNTGQNDVSEAIDSFLRIELNYNGQYIDLTELVLRCKAQAAGDITVTSYKNSVEFWQMVLSMVAEVTNQQVRRHWRSVNVQDQHITLKIQHDTADEDMFLQDLGLGTQLWEMR